MSLIDIKFIGLDADHEKIDTNSFQNTLEGIDLNSYGSGIKKINFIFISNPNKLFEEKVIYTEENVLNVFSKLQHEKVRVSTKNQILFLMQENFLYSMIKLKDNLNIENFSFNIFIKDLEKIFKLK